MFSAICLLLCVQLIRGKTLEQLAENDLRPRCSCGGNSSAVQTRVVGGEAVPRDSFPYASGLLFKTFYEERKQPVQPYCGGTLITDRHVLTAAHCLKGRVASEISVDVGVYSLSDDKDGRIISARKITKYPEYKPDRFHTDIGIIELERSVPFDSRLHAVPIASPHLDLKAGTTVFVYGWGRLSYDGDHPDTLHAVDLPVMDNEECRPKFMTRIEPNMLCAGGKEGKDACIGDSGSGLVVQLENQFVLCGVVSFGRRCALPDVPGVYTRVSSFVDWILEKTRTAGCRPCIYGESK